jgi:hypothetical protein
VFKAAAEAGTDYLDLCGEPEFIERMELTCADAARASGALMACASAFDSVSRGVMGAGVTRPVAGRGQPEDRPRGSLEARASV